MITHKPIKVAITGTIVRVNTFQGLDTYILDNGYSWGDVFGTHKKGDIVLVQPGTLGWTIRVTAVSPAKDRDND